MKTTRRPRQRLKEKLGDYNARLRMWLEENNASRYAVQHGEVSEEQADRNIAALAAQLAEEPLPPIHLAPSYKPARHAEDERLEDCEDPAAPATPIDLGYLQSQLSALTARVVDLEKLVASTVAYRSLKAAAKAKVDRIDPSIGAAFKDRRTLLALTIYDHVAELPRKKKASANFPKPLLGEFTDLSLEHAATCRVIPYTALLHRLAAKKDFQPSQEEHTSQENARLAVERSGLHVTTMHEAGLRQGSAMLIVMDRVEAAARGLVKGLAPVDTIPAPEPEAKPEPQPQPVVIKKRAWEIDEAKPEPQPQPVAKPSRAVIEDELVKPAPALKQRNPRFTEWNDPEPTTVDVVDDEGGIDDEPWEEEEEQPDEDFALFRTPEEEPQKAAKSSKAIDLFAE